MPFLIMAGNLKSTEHLVAWFSHHFLEIRKCLKCNWWHTQVSWYRKSTFPYLQAYWTRSKMEFVLKIRKYSFAISYGTLLYFASFPNFHTYFVKRITTLHTSVPDDNFWSTNAHKQNCDGGYSVYKDSVIPTYLTSEHEEKIRRCCTKHHIEILKERYDITFLHAHFLQPPDHRAKRDTIQHRGKFRWQTRVGVWVWVWVAVTLLSSSSHKSPAAVSLPAMTRPSKRVSGS